MAGIVFAKLARPSVSRISWIVLLKKEKVSLASLSMIKTEIVPKFLKAR